MITRTYPPRIGGPGAVVHQVANTLVEEGFDISIVTQKIADAPNFEELNGVKVHRTYVLDDTKEFGFANLGIGIGAMTKKLLQLRDHDFFHAHDISVAGFAGCSAKQVLRNKPFFLKYCGDLVMEYLGLKKIQNWDPKLGLKGTLKFRTGMAQRMHKIQDWYFKNYDLILPCSQYMRDFLVERGNCPEEKLKILFNGMDTKRFAPVKDREELRKELGFKGKVIFTAARMVDWKGYDFLIKAFAQIKDKDARLVMGGSGPEEENLKRLAKEAGVWDRMTFPGAVSREDMPRYLAASDMFIMPSYFDTAPMSVIEAMSCSIPCVISKDVGMDEFTEGGCGLLANVGDSNDIAEQLKKLLADEKLRQKMGKAGRKMILKEYDWKVITQRYKELYESWSN